MKPRKKNSFWTFIFSLVPGAAQMYMGFLKSGISIMILFIIPLMFSAMMYGGDYLSLISAVVYAVGFFHARNLATAPDEEFETLEDIKDVFGNRNACLARELTKTYEEFIIFLLISAFK